MRTNLLLFALLGICTNTVVPVPFEPVLLFYLSKHSIAPFILLAVGSICAALGGFVDVSLSAIIRKCASYRFAVPQADADARFYLATFLFAFLPLPFSFIRVNLIKIRPHVPTYCAAILLGRLPRYLLFTKTVQLVNIPVAVMVLLLIFVATYISRRYFVSRHNLSGV